MNNPWQDMQSNTQRRADAAYEAFYMVDLQGKYAFCIRSPRQQSVKAKKLKGMLMQAQNSERGTELFIAICDNKEWSIFARLCEDLLATMRSQKCTSENLLETIDERLDEWREFLHLYKGAEFSFARQMGLFSELLCLKELIAAQVGLENAVNAWVGAQKDKQDFTLNSTAIEVKSYISSKGASVEISSAQQLYSDKERFYLVAYGLTQSRDGRGCEDLVLEIENALNESPRTKQIFRKKLLEYGFMGGAQGDKFEFVADSVMIFAVDEAFPKITPQSIAPQITQLNYKLNLAQCQAFAAKEFTL